MRIGIIGAGAVGMLFGAYLSKAGHDISFLVRNKSLKELYIKTNDITEPIECQIVNSIEALHQMDIIIVAVKYHDLSSLKKFRFLTKRNSSTVYTKWSTTFTVYRYFKTIEYIIRFCFTRSDQNKSGNGTTLRNWNDFNWIL